MPAPTSSKHPSPRQVTLLISMAVLALGRPFLGETLLGVDLVEFFLLIAVVAGVLCTARTRIDWILLSTSALFAIGTAGIHFFVGSLEEIVYFRLVTLLVFFGLVGLQLVKLLLAPARGVGADTVLAASSAYLILGIAWSMAFALLEYNTPGSFEFPEGVGSPGERFDRFLGFSFTTLTTLGYGNIAPATPKADSLAISEAMAGQAYTAIVVARLVGLHMAESMARTPPPEAPPNDA